MDPAEMRRKNLIPPFDDGHTVATGLTYDSGNYHGALDKAARSTSTTTGLARGAGRRRAPRAATSASASRTYVEICGLGPSQVAGAIGFEGGLWESAIVRFHPSGKVNVFIGI